MEKKTWNYPPPFHQRHTLRYLVIALYVLHKAVFALLVVLPGSGRRTGDNRGGIFVVIWDLQEIAHLLCLAALCW